MNKIVRSLNQNKLEVAVIAIIIIFVIGAIHLINFFVKNSKTQESSEPNVNNETQYGSLKSVIDDEDVATEAKKTYKDLINEFLAYCNNKEVDKAYGLVSDDCKNVVFNNSIENFKNIYYMPRFASSKNYTIENWKTYIFRVLLQEDIMATGGANDNKIEDYIGGVNENGQNKLNIAGFIGTVELNSEMEEDNIRIKVLKKYRFMDYEQYEIEAENKTGKDIFLDDLKNTNTIYLTDSNKIQHSSTIENLTQEQLHIGNGGTTRFVVKFINPYISNRVIKKVTFSNIMVQGNEQNKLSINVNL